MKPSDRKSLRLWLTVGIVVAFSYSSSVLLLFLLQNRLIFNPSPRILQTPGNWQLDYEDVYLPVRVKNRQIERIHGWWIPATSPELSPVLLYLHGKSGNISSNVYQAAQFHKLGFSILLIDYRGYGLSEGKFPSKLTVYQDVEVAWNYLVGERQIPAENIIVYGQSLGGAIAIELGQRENIMPGGLIVESSFTSMQDMVEYRYPIFNIFPVSLLLRHEFDSLGKVRSLSLPLLFIHGLADERVPALMSQQLFETAVAPKKILLVSGAGHNNVAGVSGENYWQTVRKFVKLVEERQTITNN